MGLTLSPHRMRPPSGFEKGLWEVAAASRCQATTDPPKGVVVPSVLASPPPDLEVPRAYRCLLALSHLRAT
jgi:hypothetical protein